MAYRIELIDGEWYAIESKHGREFEHGPYTSERQAMLAMINRQVDAVDA